MAWRGHNRELGGGGVKGWAIFTILSRFFVMLVFLFCKLFEHYRQTNFLIIKTMPFNALGARFFFLKMLDFDIKISKACGLKGLKDRDLL